jgi:hypothetical protein
MCPITLIISRRECLNLIRAVLLGSGIAAMQARQSVLAKSKADKRDFYYQEKPKDGKSCASCKMFSLANGSVGTCAIVDGDVSPNGWCLAYSPRSS